MVSTENIIFNWISDRPAHRRGMTRKNQLKVDTTPALNAGGFSRWQRIFNLDGEMRALIDP
jgi:hypothetical protein